MGQEGDDAAFDGDKKGKKKGKGKKDKPEKMEMSDEMQGLMDMKTEICGEMPEEVTMENMEACKGMIIARCDLENEDDAFFCDVAMKVMGWMQECGEGEMDDKECRKMHCEKDDMSVECEMLGYKLKKM